MSPMDPTGGWTDGQTDITRHLQNAARVRKDVVKNTNQQKHKSQVQFQKWDMSVLKLSVSEEGFPQQGQQTPRTKLVYAYMAMVPQWPIPIRADMSPYWRTLAQWPWLLGLMDSYHWLSLGWWSPVPNPPQAKVWCCRTLRLSAALSR